MASLAFGTATQVDSINYQASQQPINPLTPVYIAPTITAVIAPYQNSQIVLPPSHPFQASDQIVLIRQADVRNGTLNSELCIRPEAGGAPIAAATRVLILSEPAGVEDKWTFGERVLTKIASVLSIALGSGLLTGGMLSDCHTAEAFGALFLAGGVTSLIYYDMQYPRRVNE